MPADPRRLRRTALALVALASLLALVALNVHRLGAGPDSNGIRELVLTQAFLPRLAVSLLAGATLGLAATIFQQLLQNPLAAPETLGVSAGAQLALTIGLLLFPAFHARHPDVLALLGATGAWGLVAAISWRRPIAPVTLILVGFVLAFVLGALASLLMLLYQEYLTSLLIWGAGSLVQDGWDGAQALAWQFLLGAAVAALMVRPLVIVGFGDVSAASLGVSLRLARPILFGTAVFLSASVAAVVGVVGFVGLASPHLARLLGAEGLRARLVAAPLAGAALLGLVDQALQLLSGEGSGALPTGAVVALLGAPLLILLLRGIPTITLEGPIVREVNVRRDLPPGRAFFAIGLLMLVAIGLALFVGRDPDGFTFGLDMARGAFEWRLPRVLASAGAGLALGVSGCLVQRLFANPMASPEVLGIGGGVAVGLILVLLLAPMAGAGAQLLGGIAGAVAVAAIVLGSSGRGFTPERLLLVGIAVTALLNAVTLLFLALGDARIGQVLAWLGGSTYRATPDLAFAVLILGLAGLGIALPLGRWLDILPFGTDVTRSLGVPVAFARIVVLLVGAVTAGAAATVIGPMSFVGLLAPHIATSLGLTHARPQLLGASGIGAIVLVLADWIGRIVFAPTELPAGILAVFIGTLAIAAISSRRRAPS